MAASSLALSALNGGLNVIMDNHIWIETQKQCLIKHWELGRGREGKNEERIDKLRQKISTHDFFVCANPEKDKKRTKGRPAAAAAAAGRNRTGRRRVR